MFFVFFALLQISALSYLLSSSKLSGFFVGEGPRHRRGMFSSARVAGVTQPEEHGPMHAMRSTSLYKLSSGANNRNKGERPRTNNERCVYVEYF
jgi:hypothetical protein